MLWISDAELAAAVSNSGALGIVSPLAGMNIKGDPSTNLIDQILNIKMLTDKSYGVNIPLDLRYSNELIDIVCSLKPPVCITSAGDPGRFTQKIKRRKITVLHVVSSVQQALKAESCGVDCLIAEGIEAAAHNGRNEIPLFSLIPQVADAVSVPVVAAGGIVDARGMMAAFSLGADGVQLGTRFLMTHESKAHANYKQAIIRATDTDTLITGRSFVPTRNLKTSFSERLAALENTGASTKELAEFIGFRSNRTAQIEGDLNGGEAYCGSSAGLIKEVLGAGQVAHRIVQGIEQVLKELDLRTQFRQGD